MPAPIRLYRSKLSGHAHRVELLLSLLALPVELVDVDLRAGAHKTPAFLAKNPFGQVPVIEDGDVTVCDVYPRSPRMIVISTVRAGEKASSARPIAVGWAGTVAAELNEVAGRGPGTFSM